MSPGGRSGVLKASTKLPNESVQKLPNEGGGVVTIFHPYYVISCLQLSFTMQYSQWKVEEKCCIVWWKVVKNLHIMDENLHNEWKIGKNSGILWMKISMSPPGTMISWGNWGPLTLRNHGFPKNLCPFDPRTIVRQGLGSISPGEPSFHRELRPISFGEP